MQKGTIGTAKIGASLALLAVAVIFSVYIIMPALAVLDDTANTIVLRSPANNTYISNLNGNITLNASLAGTNVSDNTTFYYLNGTSVTLIGKNQTVGPNNFTFTFNTTFLKDGVYSFFVNATNLTGAVVNATNGNITVDNTNPVLNFPTPTNAGYVYGTSSQLFQINATETNFNAAKNVTLSYKVNTTSTWTQTTLICYNSTGLPNANSGPFKCNTTINMPGSPNFYIENDLIQYYFNTTDFAGNTGNNGTASTPNTIILDQTKPTPTVSTTNDTDSIIGKGTGINLSVRWTDNYALYNATLSTNETGSWINWTTAYGSPYTLSGAADWSNFTWVNNSIVGGTVVAWKVYANDQVQPTRNENVSIQGIFTIDGTAPRYVENTNASKLANGTVYDTSNNYGFQINITDSGDISKVFFQLGKPAGTMANSTVSLVDGFANTYAINFTQAALGPVGTYNMTWFMNDTSNNWNYTATVGYTTVKAATLTSLWLNGTAGNRMYNVGAPYNFTSALNISGKTMKIDSNITGWVIQSYTNSNVSNESTVPMTPAVYNITGYFEATENYTASSQTYYATVSGWMNTTVSVNDTYVKAGDGLNIGCLLRDANSSAALEGYYVEIYNNTINMSAGRTNSNGIFNYTFTPSVDGQSITAKCAVYNNYTSLYNTSVNGTAVYTMDSTAPVLSSPIPTNNSYITGTSAQLFQINLTETNIDSTKNVTLNYKRAGITAWTQSTLVCYNSTGLPNANSGPFKCNVTADLTGIGNNQIVQYYFNTTDLSGNPGNHGTAINWLNATIERGIPQYIANASSPATYANYSASGNYGFQINWTNGAAGIQNVIFQLGRPVGTLSNYTAIQNGSSTYIYNTSQAALGPAGTYNVTWYANDSAGNANTTGTYGYQIYNASNIVNVYLRDNVSESANANLATTYGNTTNITATASAGTVYIYRNVTLKLINGTSPQTETFLFGAGGVTYKVNASGNENYTDNASVIQYNITIAKASPSSYLNLQINGTGADSSRAYPNITNVTGWSNLTGQDELTFTLFRNALNVTINATAAPYDRAETIRLGVGNYTYIYNTTGNANYTSGSISRSLNITRGVPLLGLHINDTSGNQTYIYTTVTRITANNSDAANYDGVYELFRNNTNLTGSGNNTNATLAAGVYLYVHNVTAGTNYTSGTTSVYLTISKAATNVSLWLNGTAGNKIDYNRYDIANFTAKLNVSGKNVSIYVNGTLLNTSDDSSSRLENTTNLTAYTSYNITAHFAGDENYTASVQQYNATTIDTIGPTIRVYNATAQQFLNLTKRKSGDTLILNISASDSGIGISASSLCVVTIGGSAAGSINYSSGWCNGTVTVPSLSTGYRVINITLNDTNNNTGFNDTFALSIDNIAPVISLTAPSNLSYNKKNADGFVWINGTAYDNLGMGVTNVTISGNNASQFAVWSFDGTNNSAFAIRNSTYVGDGLVNLTLYYNDSMNNTVSMVVHFYEDNTPPSAAVGLTNSTAGTYQSSATQVVQVAVTDALQANASITLNYTNFATGIPVWTSVRMTGVPGTTTVYSVTIDTRHLTLDTGYVIQYYINGTDNATNWITGNIGGNGTMGSTLANITINKYCGNNGTVWTNGYCSNNYLYETGWNQISLPSGSIVNTWSSLSGNRTTPKVLDSIAGRYNSVYHYNGSQWTSYDPSVPWSQNDLKYMNITNNNPYHFNMTAAGVIRIT